MKKRILVIDNETLIVEVVVGILGLIAKSMNAEFAISFVTTVQDGLSRINDYAFDLVITDFDTGEDRLDRNGKDIIEAVRKVQPETRIILMSGSSADELKGCEPDALVLKPFNVEHMQLAVIPLLTDKHPVPTPA